MTKYNDIMLRANEIEVTDTDDLVNDLVVYFWYRIDLCIDYNLQCAYIEFGGEGYYKSYKDIIVYGYDGKYEPTEVLEKAVNILEEYGYKVDHTFEMIKISWSNNEKKQQEKEREEE